MGVPTSAKCSVCTHPMAEQINEMLGQNANYAAIQSAVQAADPTYLVPTGASLSRHFKSHYAPNNIKALIWKNGQVCFADGTPVTPVSAISFLDAVIALAAKNVLDRPHAVGTRDALIAVELLLKIRTGMDKLDDFEQAWTDFLKHGKGKARKRARKVAEERDDDVIVVHNNLPAPVEYEGFDEDEEEE